jgi:hypothetical protein
MNTNSKAEIRKKVEDGLNKMLSDLKIVQPSKEVRSLIGKAAKRIAKQLRDDLKKKLRSNADGSAA